MLIQNEKFLKDTLVMINENHEIQFSSILDNQIDQGIYFLTIKDEVQYNNLPIIKQFIVDNTMPDIFSDKTYKGISKIGNGHFYHLSDLISLSFQDNFIFSNNDIVFNLDSSTTSFLDLSDSLDALFTLRWGESETENINYISQKIKPVLQESSITNFTGSIDSIYTNIINTDSTNITSIKELGINEMISNLEISITDQAGNIKKDTLLVSLSLRLEKLLSGSAFNFPNPFNNVVGEGTRIRYVLNENAKKGKLIIIDAGGNVVYYEQIQTDDLTIGTHYLNWSGKNNHGYRLASGVYFTFLEFDGMINEKIKIVILNK